MKLVIGNCIKLYSLFGEEDINLFGTRALAIWTSDNSRTSVDELSQLADQLRDLNAAPLNDIQWYISSDKVFPRAISVARLLRSKLGKTLVFKKISLQTLMAPFERQFALYTNRAKASASFLEQLSTRLSTFQADILDKNKNLTSELRVSNGNLTNLQNITTVLATETIKLRLDVERLAGLKESSAEIDRLETALLNASQQLAVFETQLKELNSALTTQRSTVATLSSQVNSLGVDSDKTKGSVDSLRSNVTTILSKLNGLTTDVENLKLFSENLRSVPSQMNGLSTDVDKLKSNVDSLRMSLATVAFQSSGFTSEIDKLRDNIENLRTSVTTGLSLLTIDLNNLKNSLENLRTSFTTLSGLTNDVNSLKTGLENLRASIALVSSVAVRRCRICFKEISGNDNGQCLGNRDSCSQWSDGRDVGWTLPYHDDTDSRDGWCTLIWVVQCESQ